MHGENSRKIRVRGVVIMQMLNGWRNVGFEFTKPRRFFQGFLAAKKSLPERRAVKEKEKNIPLAGFPHNAYCANIGMLFHHLL